MRAEDATWGNEYMVTRTSSPLNHPGVEWIKATCVGKNHDGSKVLFVVENFMGQRIAVPLLLGERIKPLD